MKKICMFLAAMTLVAAIVTACGGSDSTSQTTDTATANGTATSSEAGTGEKSATATAGATITIANMAFGEPLTVAPGAEINIANNDSVEHSVTSETKGTFDVHVDGGKEKTLTAPTHPGEYPFYCVYHPNMKATLIVK